MRYYLGPYQQTNEEGAAALQPPTKAVGSIDLRSVSRQDQTVFGFLATPDGAALPSEYEAFGQGDLRDIKPSNADTERWRSLLGMQQAPAGETLLDLLWSTLTTEADASGIDGPRPLMPTVGSRLELHLGGHSPIRAKRFSLDMAEATPVRESLRMQFASNRQAVRDGALPEDHHLRVLDFWREKYRLDHASAVAAFVPSKHRAEARRRVPHQTTINDDFNRADQSGLGTSVEGWSWANVDGTFDIVGNTAKSISAVSGVASVRAEQSLSSDDQFCQATVTGAGTGRQEAVCARFLASGGDFYRFRYRLSPPKRMELWKRIGGVFTQIGSLLSETGAVPHIVRLEVDGSTLRGYVDGVLKRTETDTAIVGNLRCGLQSGLAGDVWDLFSAGDLNPPPFNPSWTRHANNLLGAGLT